MTESIRERLQELLRTDALGLPFPASGATPERLARLSELARCDTVSIARLAEAHTDAVAILHEAGRRPEQGLLYGVWASQDPARSVALDLTTCRLSGTMGFASGLGIIDRALVTARTKQGTLLVDVDVTLDRPGIDADPTSWSSPALADTATAPVSFDEHAIGAADVLGESGWYLDRAGFWPGACGPAACWAGAAIGLVDAADHYSDDNPHRRAHHGALLAQAWSLHSLLDSAGRQIDAADDDPAESERIARSLRFAVVDICRDVLDRFGRAFGPRPYVGDSEVSQRAMDLDLYIKQHHGERELPRLADLSARDPR